MIILDTDVLSEFLRPVPDAKVRRWLDAQRRTDLWTTAITIAELAAGVAALPKGRRRLLLQDALDLMLEGFEGRVLPFGVGAAIEYGRIVAERARIGRPLSIADAQISAISAVAGATLATRNVRDLEVLGVDLVNPWSVATDDGRL